MKKVSFGLIGFFLVLLLGCASIGADVGIAGKITTTSRETIEGKMTVETLVLVPRGMSFDTSQNMGLSIIRVKTNDVLNGYAFTAEIHLGNWIFAEGIAVKIDDNIYRLTDANPNHVVRSGNYVIEQLKMEISPEIIESIKSGSTFTAELHRRMATLNDDIMQKLKDFVSE